MKTNERFFRKLGANLRVARLAAGLSQRELADNAGCHKMTISGIERGTENPSLIILVKLANELRVTMNDLLRGT
jgi:transcriptional regulator with XRE-family HTH domain